MGAVPALLRAWPEAQVLLHEDEAPFLLGPQQYLPPGSTALRVQQALGALPRQFVKVWACRRAWRAAA